MIVNKVSETADDIFCAKKSGRFLHRDRPLANIYVNNQKVLLEGTSDSEAYRIADIWISRQICCRYFYHRYVYSYSGRCI